jgi:hypothetical protein
MKRLLPAALLLSALSALPAFANDKPSACATARDGRLVCPQPDARCVADRYGDIVCSSPGGGIVFNRYGEPVCGPGRCTTDRRGDVFCSSAPRGAAAVDRFGNAACSVECVAAKTQACVKPNPAG